MPKRLKPPTAEEIRKWHEKCPRCDGRTCTSVVSGTSWRECWECGWDSRKEKEKVGG